MVRLVDTFSPAWQMVQALQDGTLSALQLLALHQRRVERLNGTVNALIAVDFDDARRRAEAIDRTGERGLLGGLPVTVKDCIDVAGFPTTAGDARRSAAYPARDATVVHRLRSAGGIVMGKTNVPPYAGDWQSNNEIFGRSLNPWDLTRTPGGSTGGGAAAVAVGLSPLEFGSDLAGSLRVPAAFCAIYGHRPSETLVPRTGHVPGSSLPNPALHMSVQGPLARSPRDLLLALEVIAGPDEGEDVAWQVSLPPARCQALREFRVAVLPAVPWMPVERAIQDAIDQVSRTLYSAGATCETTNPPFEDGLRGYYRDFLGLLWATTTVRMAVEARVRLAARFRAAGDDLLSARARGLDSSAADFVALLERRESQRAVYREFFRHWDVLLAPVCSVRAFPHCDFPFSQRTLSVDGQIVPYDDMGFYPSLASLTGQPATAFPVGRAAGLPVGLQVIGPYLEDRTPIQFVQALGAVIGGFEPPPGFTDAAGRADT